MALTMGERWAAYLVIKLGTDDGPAEGFLLGTEHGADNGFKDEWSWTYRG